MSLWRHRTQIERAVAGELTGADEARLREHLAGCLDCRRYYDTLSMQARILAGDPHAGDAERELARLLQALEPEKHTAATPSPFRLFVPAGILAALIALAAAALGGVEDERVDLRGGTANDARLTFFLVTAPRDGGPLKRDLSFPGPQGDVRADEWVAFAVNQNPDPKAAHFRGVLVNAKGETLVLASGKSVALDPGPWRVFGVVSPRPPDDAALAAAARTAGLTATTLPGAGLQATGVFTVIP